MNNLACTYSNQGRWTEAEKLEVQVMETRKTVLGPEHPDTLTSMWNLSLTLKGLRRHDEALSMLQACVQLQNQRLGPSHPDTVEATVTLKTWQERFKDPSIQGPASTRQSPFPLRYISRAISTVHKAVKSKKEK